MKRGKWFCLFWVVVFIITGGAGNVRAEASDPRFIRAEDVSLTDWIARIPDEALITEINMPGTHDSGTQYMNIAASHPLASCQYWSISEQLEHGIRVLDIRVEGNKNVSGWKNMYICHDCWRCVKSSSSDPDYLYLGDVVNASTDFLKKHTGETVVIYMSPDAEKEKACSPWPRCVRN